MKGISSAAAFAPIQRLRRVLDGRPARWLARFGARGDAVAAILIALVMAMMVVPLPALVIDALIAVNIAAAVLLIALALYMPSAVSFSSFPVVLLLTTLFRLGIEVSTSRSILLHADAGDIVDTFGRFVAGDDLVVGLIVFSIIAIVQFLVVTKGAERVAEVGARFTLDSIPGRQMAIDADLRAGFTRPETAQYLREELARESRMHGAMDGAMRFVKGDAIAGLAIVVVNLTAGIAIGVTRGGLSFDEALERYSILTIGNALIAQIPALLIAIAAAVLITRGGDDAASPASTVGGQIARQLIGAPWAWMLASFVMTVFAVVPGMPWFVFLLLALVMGATGVMHLRREARAHAHSRAPVKPPDPAVVPDDVDVRQIVPLRPIVVSLSSQLADEGAVRRLDALTRAIRRVRNELVLRYGMTVPVIEIDRVARLTENMYEIAIHEVVVASGQLHWDRVCVTTPDEQGGISQTHAIAQSFPLLEAAVWIEPHRLPAGNDEPSRGLDAIGYVSLLMRRLLQRHAGRFVGIHEAQLVFNWLQREMPATAKELAQALTLPRFAQVMKLLIAERVSLRNVREIAETLVVWAPREQEACALAEHVRIALGAQICDEFAEGGVLFACLLERALEARLREALQEGPVGVALTVEPGLTQDIVRQTRALAVGRGECAAAPVLLTTQSLRRPLRQLLADDLPETHVLSYAELISTQRVHVLGSLSLPAVATAAAAAVDPRYDGA
ncbi:flagellar biosynthesis protein FlhA [Trinickia diaoshuihuensis]|uniref:flagellar biosynthesis protein FlhA n=1 Tax=Trinickia diaoshuihuensis TaxID=2292265 RepID=UPI0013C32A38|nr:flagellar biosynthesis protein FlhA [Trinickia diaoshuihuensis]